MVCRNKKNKNVICLIRSLLLPVPLQTETVEEPIDEDEEAAKEEAKDEDATEDEAEVEEEEDKEDKPKTKKVKLQARPGLAPHAGKPIKLKYAFM